VLRLGEQSVARRAAAGLSWAPLLEAAVRMNLEGIVSKKRAAPYGAGSNSGWIKVKTREWREMNRERYKLFEKA
jgi:ATP-dependent DNA ligase